MATPFASKLFENSNNSNDGWSDDWGWSPDNNNASNTTKTQSQHFNQESQVIPPPSNLQQQQTDGTANYFNPMNNLPLPPQPIIEQYSQQIQAHNTIGPVAIANNNNHVTGVFYAENQYQQQSLPTGIESPFVNNNNQTQSINNNDGGNSFAQSTTAIPNFQQNQNQNQYLHQYQQQQQPLPTGLETGKIPNGDWNTSERRLDLQHQQQQQNQPLPPPPPIIEQQSNENGFNNFVATSQIDNNPQSMSMSMPISDASLSPQIPVFNNNALPPVATAPSLNQSPFANTNPFKRVGSHAHRTPPPPPTTAIDNFNNQLQRSVYQENVEPITNDRNEYLQTGHLSEDGSNNANVISQTNIETQIQSSSSDGNGDNLPPPGLSRLVLGEPEATDNANSQIPPGLDRLVTGTEINRAANLNLERQADGQDEPTPRNNQFANVQSQLQASPINLQTSIAAPIQNYETTLETDRNQYLVAGENPIDNANQMSINSSNLPNTNTERVVTGFENVENLENSLPEPDTNYRQNEREVDMDGENLEDQQQQQNIQNRQSNALPKASNFSHADSIENLHSPNECNQKNQSNPSSGNDDSDHEQPYYNRNKGIANRRSEERHKKRDDSKHENRYETEDTDHSMRDRKRKENDRYAEKDRQHRRRDKDIDENDSRSFKRGEKQYRDKKYYRDDDERYESRHRDGRTRDDKYISDGSHYERNRRRSDRDREHGRFRDDNDRERYYRTQDFERGKQQAKKITI